jgi:hypothetical protein
VPVVTLSRRSRRLVGSALIVYGVAGLLLIGSAGMLVGSTIATIADVSNRVTEQRDALVATLRATSQTVDDAGTGIGGVGASLTMAKTSAEHATGLAGSLGQTLRELSSAMHIQIFGTEPLAGLSAGFDQAAAQSDALATDLRGVSAALGANTADLETSRRNLVTLGASLDRLVEAVDATPLGASLSTGVPPVVLEAAFVGLLVWLAVPALGALALGIGLLRGTLR